MVQEGAGRGGKGWKGKGKEGKGQEGEETGKKREFCLIYRGGRKATPDKQRYSVIAVD